MDDEVTTIATIAGIAGAAQAAAVECCTQCGRGPFPPIPPHPVKRDDYIFHIYTAYPQTKALCGICYTRWCAALRAFAKANQ